MKIIKAPKLYIDSPICWNHAFQPGLTDSSFQSWREAGIVKMKDLYIEDRLASFQHLQQRYQFPASHFFRYLQIRHFLRTCIVHYEQKPQHVVLDRMADIKPFEKGSVSRAYNVFLEQSPTSSEAFKQSWEEELGTDISVETWKSCTDNIHNSSINARLGLIQFKVVHRLHFCQSRLSKFSPEISSLCPKCSAAEGTLSHQFLTCHKLNHFWNLLFGHLSEVYNRTIMPDPIMALFGVVAPETGLDKYEVQAVALSMLLAKRLILQHWKSEAVPTFDMWIMELGKILHLERIRFIKEKKEHDFFEHVRVIY